LAGLIVPGSSDERHVAHHFLAPNALAVRATAGEGDAGAGRGDGQKAGGGENARAGGAPDIGQD